MKRILLLILAAMLVSFASAQPQSREELKLLTTLYYDLNEVFVPKAEFDKLDEVIEMLRSDATIKVQIEGYGDPLGGEAVNERVSRSRAQRVADYLLQRNVAELQISFVGCGIDTSAESDAKARRVDVSQIITVVIETTPSLEDQKIAEAEAKAEQERIEAQKAKEAVVIEQLEPQISVARQPIFAIKSNVIQLGVGVANIGVECGVGDRYSIDLPIAYSPYTIKNSWRIRTLMIQPEFRYWLNEPFTGHFFGAHTHIGCFNVSVDDQSRYQNSSGCPLWGFGVSYGYGLNLYKSLNLEFNIGVGYANIKYDTYFNIDNGALCNTNQQRNYWGITRAGVSLVYMFNLKK